MEVLVNIKKNHVNAIIPKYQTDGSAGFDLHSAESGTIFPGETLVINTGLSFEIPLGYEIQIRPRSGISLKTKIRVSNSPGTVDSDFRGVVGIIIDNIGTESFCINVGDRIAQGVLCPVAKAIFNELDQLSDTSRGSGAYGSSGV